MLTVKDAARRLAVSKSKLYRMLADGEMPHFKIGGALRISEEQLAAYLETTRRDREEPAPAKSRPPRPRLRHIRL